MITIKYHPEGRYLYDYSKSRRVNTDNLLNYVNNGIAFKIIDKGEDITCRILCDILKKVIKPSQQEDVLNIIIQSQTRPKFHDFVNVFKGDEDERRAETDARRLKGNYEPR